MQEKKKVLLTGDREEIENEKNQICKVDVARACILHAYPFLLFFKHPVGVGKHQHYSCKK